jgi:hypothetical protein
MMRVMLYEAAQSIGLESQSERRSRLSPATAHGSPEMPGENQSGRRLPGESRARQGSLPFPWRSIGRPALCDQRHSFTESAVATSLSKRRCMPLIHPRNTVTWS